MSEQAKNTNQIGHWAQFNEVTFVAGMRLLFWVYRLLGRWPFRIVLYPVLTWYVLTQAAPRQASQAYLGRVSAYTSVRTGWWGVLRHFAAFSETMLDKMLLWGGLFKEDRVQYSGKEEMQTRLDAGQGGLMICSHLGNLEMCRVLSCNYPDVKLTVLVHTKHAQAFNQLLAQLDPRSQLDLVQVTEMTPATAMMLSEKVQQGGFVVIAGDRVPVSPQPRVTTAPFLGHDAAFPIGPYVLASILQCPVFLLFSLQIDGRPHVHFELLTESLRLPRKDPAPMLREIAAAYAARLQYFCLRAPLQWFNFYDFWQLPELMPKSASHLHVEHSDV